jgi:serine/threonine protein kinase
MHLIYKFCSGKTYIGMMPSGMRVAIKRLKEGVEVCHFLDEICEKAKIRHPNLVGIIGYCNKGDQSLVYEYCLNGDLATWLLGKFSWSLHTSILFFFFFIFLKYHLSMIIRCSPVQLKAGIIN